VRPPRHFEFGHVAKVAPGAARGGAHRRRIPGEDPHSIGALQDASGILEQHGDAAVSVAGEDAPRVNVQNELFGPASLKIGDNTAEEL
jgi:hypothetical protein